MKQQTDHSAGRGKPRASSSFDRCKKSNKRAKVAAQSSNDEFPKLDQSNPVHARRIQQRRRHVAFGKNTVGYDEYIKKVPKHKRRPRSMEHPMTPDHTLDIPTKRWQGLVKAWRKSLHQYDPADLMKSFSEEASPASSKSTIKPETETIQQNQDSSTSERLSESSPGTDDDLFSATVSPSVVETPPREQPDELDAWEEARRDNDNEFLLEDEDSDDDLL